MKVFAIAPLLLSTLVAGLSIFSGNDQVAIADNTPVPGESPLNYCQANHEGDLLVIDHINLDPNPPLAGKSLKIEATGTLLEDVEEGAYILLQIKYGLIQIIKMKVNLCEQTKNVDLNCPIKKGYTVFTKDVDLPSEIPPGKYTVLADVFTKDDEHITCLTATIAFSR